MLYIIDEDEANCWIINKQSAKSMEQYNLNKNNKTNTILSQVLVSDNVMPSFLWICGTLFFKYLVSMYHFEIATYLSGSSKSKM